MNDFHPYFLPTAIGSMPQRSAAEACDLVLRYLPEIPAWPQLPTRDPIESMYTQYFESLPGVALGDDGVFIETGERFDREVESLYTDYMAGETHCYGLSPERAAGFVEMCHRLETVSQPPVAVKGQVTGPISAGLQITDRKLRPALYDDSFADVLARYLRLVAAEHERVLRTLCPRTIVSIDEPFLSAVGSGFIQVRREQVDEMLGEVLGGLQGLKAIHCCGNTDWGFILSQPFDILSFDAYNYAETLALYPREVRDFLSRGGMLAWGIVPTDPAALAAEEASSLVHRLEAGVQALQEKGVDPELLHATSLITPACGLNPVSPELSVRALCLTAEVSRELRRRYAC